MNSYRSSFVPAAAALLLGAGIVRAQGVVVTGASSAQYIDLRPLVVDSVPYAATDSFSVLYRRTADGVLSRCTADQAYCRFFRSTAPQNLVAMMQDLDVTAWGLGRGVSVHAQLRGRTAAGDARDLWPQATQSFEALAAYLELDRDLLRARAGRQWVASGLGMYNFDGASLLMRPVHGVAAEMYGGGALVQGIGKPLGADALAPVEDLPPTDRAWLFGGTLQYRPGPRGALRVQYQREIRRDRAALYSERMAADGEIHLWRTTFTGQLTRDLALGTFNDLAAQVALPLPANLESRFELRHYAPYFDLWTIWGAFAPVGYREAIADLRWTAPGGRVALGASGGRRTYEDTHTGMASLPLRSDGWRVGANAAVRAADAWVIQGSYHMDIGFGASSSDGDVALRWQPGDRWSLGVNGTAFQNVYEFQIGEGRVIGGGFQGGLQIFRDLRLAADATVYHHTGRDQPQYANWDQRRGSVRLEWTVGSEPGFGLGPARLP